METRPPLVAHAAVVALMLSCALTNADAQLFRSSNRARGFAVKVDQDVRIDGKLDEPFWQLARPAGRFVQIEPREGDQPSKLTDVRLVFTEDAVIIGARLQDDPHVLLEATHVADTAWGGYLPDYFRVQIDPHRDHQTAFEFVVTVRGETRSGLLTAAGASINAWAIKWDVATSVDENGWSIEMRIPMSEMHVEKGSEAWGIAFQRFSWKRMETDVLDGRRPPERVAKK